MIKKLQVLGMPRSGTTYLFSLLADQVNTKFDGRFNESFHMNSPRHKHLTSEQKIELASTRLKSWCNKDQTAIAKNHTSHLNFLKRSDLIDEFTASDPYTILMVRRNIIDTTLSFARAVTTNEWTRYRTSASILVDVNIFTNRILKASTQYMTDLAKNPWRLRYDEIVYYEDLTGKPDVDLIKLKIYDEQMFTPNPNAVIITERAPDKKESIVNYDELRNIAIEYYFTNLTHPRIEFDGQTVKINPV
jgi:hypothetical protein